jgi:hypothetical protein
MQEENMRNSTHWLFRLVLSAALIFGGLAFSHPSLTARGAAAPQDDLLIFIPVAMQQHWVPAPQYPTGILNIDAFLETCPQNDPIYAQLRADFQVRIDGVVVDDIPCSEPVSAMPAEQVTYELRTLQAFRAAYYLDPQVPGYLPWTTLNLYDWFKQNVSGVNYKTTSNTHYCCDRFDGKYYISTYFQNASHLVSDLTWSNVRGGLIFYAHETRHRDPDDPGHVEGCEDFPTGSGVYGCDPAYDESQLGAYGVMRWMHWAFASGFLNIGIACSPNAEWYISNHVSSANGYASRFVTGSPDPIPMPAAPFGGPCLALP